MLSFWCCFYLLFFFFFVVFLKHSQSVTCRGRGRRSLSSNWRRKANSQQRPRFSAAGALDWRKSFLSLDKAQVHFSILFSSFHAPSWFYYMFLYLPVFTIRRPVLMSPRKGLTRGLCVFRVLSTTCSLIICTRLFSIKSDCHSLLLVLKCRCSQLDRHCLNTYVTCVFTLQTRQRANPPGLDHLPSPPTRLPTKWQLWKVEALCRA